MVSLVRSRYNMILQVGYKFSNHDLMPEAERLFKGTSSGMNLFNQLIWA